MIPNGPDVDEDKLIADKSEFERKFILKVRSLFSEKLSPSRYISSPSIQISLKQSPHKASDPSLYRFKPPQHSYAHQIPSKRFEICIGNSLYDKEIGSKRAVSFVLLLGLCPKGVEN